jgi:hypothetical protein
MALLKKLTTLIIILFISGCFSKIGSVKGKFTQNGVILNLKKSAVLQIIFYPSDANQKVSYPADFDRDTCEYVISNIPNGEYKVGLALLDPYPNNDKYNNEFSLAKSTILCKVDGITEFDINISRK